MCNHRAAVIWHERRCQTKIPTCLALQLFLIFVLLASHLIEFDSEKVMSAGCVGRDK